VNDIDETKGKHADHVNRQGDEELNEIAVVTTTDTVVDPWTVMVKYLEPQPHNLDE